MCESSVKSTLMPANRNSGETRTRREPRCTRVLHSVFIAEVLSREMMHLVEEGLWCQNSAMIDNRLPTPQLRHSVGYRSCRIQPRHHQ